MTAPRSVRPLVVALGVFASTAGAGVQDSPLPSFSDGKTSELVFLLPAVVKNNQVESAVICTNLAPDPIDVGIELFDKTGTRGNSVAAGNGAMLDVAPGRTITFATGSIAVLHEDVTITLDPGIPALAQGAARVVATRPALACVAFAVDAVHTVEDPATCPGCKPPTITNLPALAACSPAACDDGNACTVDGCDAGGGCTHTPVADGTPCDDVNPCTSDDLCGAGVCRGAAVVCAADTPCHLSAVCDPSSGQCMEATPFSICTPGGGGKASDCAAEWVVENPGNRKGRASSVQVCRQGDPACDFDLNARVCRFLVRVCLNNQDVNLPACQPGRVGSYELRRPTPSAGKSHERTAAAILLDAVAALGPSTRGGKRLNRLTFDPPDARPDDCTPAVAVSVPLKRALILRTRAATPGAPPDTDRLKLKCARPPRR